MKDIPGYEGLYAITTEGEVWSYRQKKFLTPVLLYGYPRVGLWKDGKVKRKFVHRIVAEAYLPNPENLPQVNHKDENRANCCLQNLEWCDAKYNANYGSRNDRIAEKNTVKKINKFKRRLICLFQKMKMKM